MPKRSSVKIATTPVEIMGEDAYVKYRPLTMNEARELREKVGAIEEKRQSALTDYCGKNDKVITELTDDERNTAYTEAGLTDELLDFADREFSKFIIEWNWVYDDDTPMPQPSEDYKVLGQLYGHEYRYIMSLFNPDENTEKN